MLPIYVRRLLRTKGDGKPVFLVVADAAILDGKAMDLETYRAKYGHAARHEVRVSSLKLADVTE